MAPSGERKRQLGQNAKPELASSISNPKTCLLKTLQFITKLWSTNTTNHWANQPQVEASRTFKIFNIEPHKHDIPVFDWMCAFLLESQVKFPKRRCHFNFNSEFTTPVRNKLKLHPGPEMHRVWKYVKPSQTLKPRFNTIKTKLSNGKQCSNSNTKTAFAMAHHSCPKHPHLFHSCWVSCPSMADHIGAVLRLAPHGVNKMTYKL